MNEVNALREENEQLGAENAKLRAENEKLRAQNVRFARELVQAAHEQNGGSPWRPIETARNDTPVLVFNGSDIAVGIRHKYPTGVGAWFIANSFGFNEDGEIPDVTHWMPLPEPPEGSK